MSTATPELNRENSVAMLINTVRAGQAKGCFLLQETSLLKKAMDYFNKDVKVKPDFGSTESPEIVSVNLLLQACQKVNQSVNNPLSVEDAALVFSCFEFWVKEAGGGVASNVAGSGETTEKSAKAVASKLKSVVEVDDEEEEEEEEEKPRERLITVKGKTRAV